MRGFAFVDEACRFDGGRLDRPNGAVALEVEDTGAGPRRLLDGVSKSVLGAICDLLEAEGVLYRLVHHEPTYTSEESARVRGESVRIGGKAILMKTDETFRLFVLSAALKVHSRAIKKELGLSGMRFASGDELQDLIGLVPGSVPPFGQPILPLQLYCDPSVFANDKIAFNAGSLTDSIIMPTKDYRRIARPVVFTFAR